MRFLLFSDLHFAPGVFMGATWEALHQMQKHAEKAGCEFIIHAGDFCHGITDNSAREEVADYVREYNDFHIPSYHAMGNHDTDQASMEEMLEYYRMPEGHYFFDRSGYRMIICDPNYFYMDGQYIHYSHRNNAEYGLYDSYMPPRQLAWLEETIASSPFPCVLISHQSFEREADGVKNAEEVRRIINSANGEKKHSVLLCINGHYHRDHLRILDNVCYWDMNSASYDWVDNSHSFYPEKLCRQFKFLNHTLVYNDCLHAIVTLKGTTIAIEGMESTMFMGITREMTDNPVCDQAGRPVRPVVQSAVLTLG